VKARKISVKPYQVEGLLENGSRGMISYQVKKSLGDIILAPQLRLNGLNLLRNSKIADKIISCEDEFVLLESTEYAILKEAVNDLAVFGKNDVELVKRVLEAEEVAVEEKKGGN
jgi:hypothetical protein